MNKFTVPQFFRGESAVHSNVECIYLLLSSAPFNKKIKIKCDKKKIHKNIKKKYRQLKHFVEYGKIAIFPFFWSPKVEMLFPELFRAYEQPQQYI